MHLARVGKGRLLCGMAASLLAVACVAAGKPASAQADMGGNIFASGGSVTATLLPSEASLTNVFFFVGPAGQVSLFNNTSPTGTSAVVNDLAAGTELVFGIQVLTEPGAQTFFSGPGDRNPDGFVHARVTFDGQTNSALLEFEDLLSGGDRDFNDTRVRLTGVTNAVIPEPSTVALLGVGLLPLAGIVRRRKG